MTEQILRLRGALQAANRNLERRVKERTAELQEALHRLNELAQLKANFISNISHELRTPLTHMKGYIELLVTGSLGPLTEDQAHALQVSQHSTNRLESLIDDLIMFSMASRGELTIKQEPTEIMTLSEICVKSAQQKAESRGVTVHIAADEDLPLVQIDPQKMSWVISQLLDNGIKFTPAGGMVVVNLRKDSDKLVNVSIVDTGIGIPPERMKEVFEPFHQLDGSSTRRYGGTGLGLSLIQEIIEAHGSIIDVKSVEGRGTTVKFPLLISASD
ncbi:MAG: HAMP domain-containing histidine kinase [Anaerolineales bacterium]|nr:HAMP domain-containing histidine kinase [Anaerolineales bacterium]